MAKTPQHPATPGEADNASISGGGIEALIRTAQEARRETLISVPTAGLGAGLPASVPLLLDPNADRYVSVKSAIEEYRLYPARKRGTAKSATLGDFIELVNRHKDPQSALFAKASWPNPSLMAVLNYHHGNDAKGDAGAQAMPRHGDHRVLYAFPLTEELKAWIGGNAKPMEQGAFAIFLEDHAAELSSATSVEKGLFENLFGERFAEPNELIALSRKLEVFVGSTVKQGVRLQSGERSLVFQSEHRTETGDRVDIPGIFMVAVRAFEQAEDSVRIPARLRYRIKEGSIAWFYQLYRWEALISDRVRLDMEEAALATGLPAFEGEPEA